MAVTKKLVTVGPLIGTGANASIYTPPSNSVAVVKQITLSNNAAVGGTPATAAVALNGSTATAGNCIIPQTHTIAGGGSEDKYSPGWNIPLSGGSIQVNLATSVSITVVLEETTLS